MTRAGAWVLVAALAALLHGGCLDVLAPDVGPLREQSQCDVADSDPGDDIDYQNDVESAILAPRCGVCHFPEGDDPIGIQMSGLDLSSYDSLRDGGNTSGDQIVVPGDPCSSILLDKLGGNPPFGARMPLNREPLPADELQVLIDWIDEGAAEN